MIFENEFQLLQILDVVTLDQRNLNRHNTPNDYDALSFRLHACDSLQTEHQTLQLGDNALTFVPHGLDYHRITKYAKLIAIHFNAVNYVPHGIEVYEPCDPVRIQSLFEKALACWNGKKDGYRYLCSSILYEIFEICHQQFAPKKIPSKIEPGVSYILEHWNDPGLTVSDAAQKANMSEVYFRKLFREEYGTTPKRYIINLRMQNAVSLLDTNYFSLQEVAERSGYTDYKHFSVEFKRIKGCSPSDYSYYFGDRPGKTLSACPLKHKGS